MPTTDPSPITRALCAELIRREQVGTEKYGKPLEPHDGRRTLVDVREELLDACVYITKCIMEQEWQPIESAPKDGTWILLYRPCDEGCRIAEGLWQFSHVYNTGRWGGRGWLYPVESQPTHWKPLPPPPTEG